jgi:DNA-directed RNA polymerase subunit M/transcription elongation factor TFIIS
MSSHQITKKYEYLGLLLGKNTQNAKDAVQIICCERPGCDSTEIESWEKQHKSGDEGASIFHKCLKCGYVFVAEDQ